MNLLFFLPLCAAAQLRDSPVGERNEYPDGAGVLGPCLRGDDHDLSARDGRPEGSDAEPVGQSLSAQTPASASVPAAFSESISASIWRRRARTSYLADCSSAW